MDELEAEVKWVLAYVSYNEQRYDDMEQLLMQPQVLERHPWGTYLIALGHRMQQSDNNQMSQDLQMLIQNSQNINLTMEEKGDINVMIASLLSEGYGNAIGMSLQDARICERAACRLLIKKEFRNARIPWKKWQHIFSEGRKTWKRRRGQYS